jgi:hypothetical protein
MMPEISLALQRRLDRGARAERQKDQQRGKGARHSPGTNIAALKLILL